MSRSCLWALSFILSAAFCSGVDQQRILWPSGVIRYEGGVKDGAYHGRGVLYYESGKLGYEGEFRNGNFHGSGKYYRPGGELAYVGYSADGSRMVAAVPERQNGGQQGSIEMTVDAAATRR